MRQLMIKSYDKTEIFATVWDDVKNPVGVIQFMHGMAEYAGRYDEFARYFNSRGYIFFADDHRGHGRTETEKTLGKPKGDVFEDTLTDELFFYEFLKKEYKLPVFFLGQSYGSFLCQALAQAGTDVKAIGLLGTGHMRDFFHFGTIMLAPVYLVARNWCPKIKMDPHWLNTLDEPLKEMEEDPLVSIPMSINFTYSMLKHTYKLYGRKALMRLNPTTAIGIFCGDDDIIGKRGRGAKKLKSMYDGYGVNCSLHLYKGARHDLAFDYCKEQVREDIADFFDKFVIYTQSSIFSILDEEKAAENDVDGEKPKEEN